MKKNIIMLLSALAIVISFFNCTKTINPMACCTVPGTGTVGVAITVTSTCSTNANAYEWNFGDGSSKITEANPSHIYTTVGTYSISLMAMNGNNMNQVSKTIIIH